MIATGGKRFKRVVRVWSLVQTYTLIQPFNIDTAFEADVRWQRIEGRCNLVSSSVLGPFCIVLFFILAFMLVFVVVLVLVLLLLLLPMHVLRSIVVVVTEDVA